MSVFADIQEAVAFWRPTATAGDGHRTQGDADPATAAASTTGLPATLPPEGRYTLRQFLGGLRGTAGYESSAGRAHLQARVGGLLDSLQDARLADTILVLLHRAMTTCGDRLIRGLDEVEQYVLVERAGRGGDPQALAGPGASLLRLEVVHAHAARKVQSLVCVDGVEVYLVYATRSADKLGLPFATRRMLYSAQVIARDLALAEADAQAASADAAHMNAWLQGWSPWQKHLRLEQAEAVRQNGYDKLAALSDAAHASAPTPWQHTRRCGSRSP